MSRSDNSQFATFFKGSENFFEMYFYFMDWRANNEQSTSFGTESILKGLPLTSRAASGYFDQIVWFKLSVCIKRNVTRFDSPWHEQ